MAEAIKKELDVDTKLIEGVGGVFDVHVDRTPIWSKFKMGRFPEPREVLDKIRTATANA